MIFNIQYTDQNLHNNTGLSIISKLIESVHPKSIFRVHGISTTCRAKDFSDQDIIFSTLGLLSLGLPHYESIDLLRTDRVFKKSLSLDKVPSKERLRQRLDQIAQYNGFALEGMNKWNFLFLQKYARPVCIKGEEMIPVDFDVTVLDNTGSHKQGVEQTYQKDIKGFAPMMTNIGRQGYLLNHEFRKGSAHSNCAGTYEYIVRSMHLARRLCPNQTLLARLDSGNDAEKNLVGLSQLENTYYLIKHHLKGRNASVSKQRLTQFVLENYTSKEVIDNTTIRYFAEQVSLVGMYDENGKFIEKECRKILSVVQINNDLNTGQPLLIPYRSLHLWRTNLPETNFSPQDVIHLYKDHATSEQFHSEFKTDLDIEKLPSSKFKTNEFIVAMAQLVFNMLRVIGHEALSSDLLNPKGKKSRLRIRTILLKIILFPCKLMRKNKIWTIALPRSNPLSILFRQIYLAI
jgi:hypothetical protein